MFGRRAAAAGGPAPAFDPLAAFLEGDDLMTRMREGKVTHEPIASPPKKTVTPAPSQGTGAQPRKAPSAMSWLEDEADTTSSQHEATASNISAANFALMPTATTAVTAGRPGGIGRPTAAIVSPGSVASQISATVTTPAQSSVAWLDSPPKVNNQTPASSVAAPTKNIATSTTASAVEVSTISVPTMTTIATSTSSGRSQSPARTVSERGPSPAAAVNGGSIPNVSSATHTYSTIVGTTPATSANATATAGFINSSHFGQSPPRLREEAAELEVTLADLNTSIAQKQAVVSAFERSAAAALGGMHLSSDDTTGRSDTGEDTTTASTMGGGGETGHYSAAESAAYERRRRAEEAKILQAQSHRERMTAIYQRSQEAISSYRRNAVAAAEGEGRQQIDRLTKAIGEERLAIDGLEKELSVSKQSSVDAAVESVLRGEKIVMAGSQAADHSATAISALNGHLLNIISRLRKDFQESAAHTLESQLTSSLNSFRDERLLNFVEDKSKRVALFKLHTEARGRATEAFGDQRRLTRQRSVEETMARIKTEWDRHVMDTKVRSSEDAAKADKRVSDDLAKLKAEGLHALQRVVTKQQGLLEDFSRSAAHREEETRSKLLMEAAHQQKLFESEKRSVEQTYRFAMEAQVRTEEAAATSGGSISFLKQVAAIEATAIHAKRLADEVDLVTYSAATQRATEDTRKIIKERESAIEGLHRHIDQQRETLMRDWVKVQHMLSNLSSDADHFGKSLAQGRSGLIASQQYLDSTRSAWEKDLFRTMGNCFAGGTGATVQRSEDIAGQILFDLNCKMRNLLMQAEALMAVRRDTEGQMHDLDEQVVEQRTKEGQSVRRLLTLYEQISKVNDDVANKQRALAIEKRDLIGAIEATQSERARVTSRLEGVQLNADAHLRNGNRFAIQMQPDSAAYEDRARNSSLDPLRSVPVNNIFANAKRQAALTTSSTTTSSSAADRGDYGRQRAYHALLGGNNANRSEGTAAGPGSQRRSSSTTSSNDRYRHLYSDDAVDLTAKTAKDFISLVRIGGASAPATAAQDRSLATTDVGAGHPQQAQHLNDNSSYTYAATALSFVDDSNGHVDRLQPQMQDNMMDLEQLHYLSSTSRSGSQPPYGGQLADQYAQVWDAMYQRTRQTPTTTTTGGSAPSSAAGATTLYANIGPSVSDRGNNSYSQFNAPVTNHHQQRGSMQQVGGQLSNYGAPRGASAASLTTPSSIGTNY